MGLHFRLQRLLSFVRLLFLAIALPVFLFIFSDIQDFFKQAQADTPTRIMVVGDSISQGHSGDYTWRYRLWQHLAASNISVDFVGPKDTVFDDNDPNSHAYLDPNFDRDHDATWGKPIIYAKDTIASEVTMYMPDVLLILLGANDLAWWGLTGEQTANELSLLTNNACSAKSDLKIILSKVTPHFGTNEDYIARLADYNSRIASVAAAATVCTSPVVVADPVTGFDAANDTYDGTHPRPSGEYKIAAAFANALATGYGIGTTYGESPVAPVWPQAPQNLIATGADTMATVTWDAVPGASEYVVYRKNITTGEVFPTVTVSTPSTGNIMLVNGNTYEYAVSTKRGYVEGPQATPVQVTPDVPLLPGPTNLREKPLDQGVRLDWDAVGTSWYAVYTRNVTRGESFVRLAWPAITNSFTGGYMVNGETYEFKITTINSAGKEGAFSETVTVIPIATPSGLTAQGGVGTALLSWGATAGANTYSIYQKDVTANETVFAKIATTSGLTSQISGLINGHTYQFQVSGVNSTGEGQLSSVIAVTPNSLALGPTGLTATAGAVNSKKVTLKWNAVPNTSTYTVTGYQIWIKDTNVAGATFSKWSDKKTATMVDVAGLIKGHTYQFKVTTVNLNNVEGPFSATVSKKAP